MNKNASTNYQYPYPAEPRNWNTDERQFSQGLRRLFDILFARKLQGVMIADGAVNGRTIAEASVAQRHLVDGFGAALDISENPDMVHATAAAGAAQNAAAAAAVAAAAAQGTANTGVAAAGAAQNAADAASVAAAAAQGTADTGVAAAADAQATANRAVTAASVAKQTADDAVTAAGAAQADVDALPDVFFPVGTIVMMTEAPSFGTWEEIDLGLQDVTAWKRVEEGGDNGGNAD